MRSDLPALAARGLHYPTQFNAIVTFLTQNQKNCALAPDTKPTYLPVRLWSNSFAEEGNSLWI